MISIFTQTDHRSSVRVAKDDLRPHVDQLIHKEQAAFEHLLMDQHTTDSLGGNHQEDTQQVRRKSRPMSAEGTSHIHNIDQIDRGYQNIDKRLNNIGARITRL